MDSVCQIVAQLCTLVCLSALLEQLLPSDTFRGPVRMACGLILVHILLSQLLAWHVPAQTQAGRWLFRVDAMS